MMSMLLDLGRHATVIRRVTGKHIDIEVLSSRSDGRRFIRGVISCPWTGKKFNFDVKVQLDQVRPGIVQSDSGFLEHARRTEQYRAWLYERIESYSRNSFHKRKYFVCAKCGFKSTRYIDTLLHLILQHGFLVKVP